MGYLNGSRSNGLFTGFPLSDVDRQRAIVVHKFGHYTTLGTSFAPICYGGVWQTPQVTGATTLRVAAGGNANDTADGTGAREITVIGLGTDGYEISETIATAGASASAATSQSFIRLNRAFVSASGTYSSAVPNSHVADIVIENGAGGTTWATIDGTTAFHAQTEIGCYAVPKGYTAYVIAVEWFSDSSKQTTIQGAYRPNILETAAPYSASRIIYNEIIDQESHASSIVTLPRGPFVGPCDLIAMGKVSATTSSTSVAFEILMVPA